MTRFGREFATYLGFWFLCLILFEWQCRWFCNCVRTSNFASDFIQQKCVCEVKPYRTNATSLILDPCVQLLLRQASHDSAGLKRQISQQSAGHKGSKNSANSRTSASLGRSTGSGNERTAERHSGNRNSGADGRRQVRATGRVSRVSLGSRHSRTSFATRHTMRTAATGATQKSHATARSRMTNVTGFSRITGLVSLADNDAWGD